MRSAHVEQQLAMLDERPPAAHEKENVTVVSLFGWVYIVPGTRRYFRGPTFGRIWPVAISDELGPNLKKRWALGMNEESEKSISGPDPPVWSGITPPKCTVLRLRPSGEDLSDTS